ncbi:Thymidylate kinase, partial [hydrothermal vent metagenome]
MSKISRGKFISFEGGEGVGKSTQINILRDRLQGRGIDVIVTREPGGAPGAEEIRTLLLTGEVDKWVPMTEVLLFYASRVDHLERTIRPALDAGQWVISDRYADSTFAYQGAGHGLGATVIDEIHRLATDNFWPDITILLDADPEEALKRATDREAAISEELREDRYEKMADNFHCRLRQAFLDIAARSPDRFRLVAAAGTIDDVSDHIWTQIAT